MKFWEGSDLMKLPWFSLKSHGMHGVNGDPFFNGEDLSAKMGIDL